MKHIKTYEGHYDIVFSVGDIVVCTTKYDDRFNYQGYIDYDDIFISEKNKPIYGKKYKIIDAYLHGDRYKKITKLLYNSVIVDVEDIDTGEIIKYLSSGLFSIETEWKKPDEPMIGDYVICKTNIFDKDLEDFIGKNIGRVVNINKQKTFVIQYLNVTNNIEDYFWVRRNKKFEKVFYINLNIDDILNYSPNKEDFDYFIDSKKYNL